MLPSSRGAPRRLGLPGAPPWQKITQRGMKAVPLLLALAKDEYLLPAESSGASFSHSDYGGWRGSSSGNSEEAVEQMYQQLSRPVTRGEVARALLQQVLPRREDSSREELDPDTLVEEVQRWYQDTGKQTPEELTTWYLEHGDQAQQQIAVAALVKTGATNNFARVEAFMLEHADELLRDGSSAGEYVRQRGRAALPFLQKLEAAALTPKKKKVAEEEEDGVIQRDDREEKAQREVLGAWRKLAEAPPAEEILREVAQHPESWAKYENVLGQQLRGPAAGKALDLLLETTIGMKDLKVRRDLLDLVWHPLYTLGRSDEKEEEPDEDAPPAAADPALTAAMAAFLTKHASAWQTLLADERPLPTAPGDADDVATFADVAAQWIERLFGREPGAENAPPGLWDAMGQALIKARARARLAHQPLPGWPKAERVTPARRAEIAARLQAAGVAELAAVVQGLTDDEKLALSEETAQRAELQKVLRPLAFSVQRVQVNGSTGELARAVLPWAGRPLTKSDVDKLIEVSRGLAAAGQSAHLKLWRGQGLTGFRVAVTEYDRTMPEYRQMFDWMIEELDHEQPARVAANLYAGERCGAFEWMVAVPAKAGVAAPVKTGSGGADVLDDMLDELKTDTSSWREEGQKQFTALLEDLFKGEAPLDWHVRLDVVVSPAIKPAGKPASGGKAGASEPVAIPWMQDLE